MFRSKTRPSAYSSESSSCNLPNPSDLREEKLNRLKIELREHIRFLSDYSLLSPEWLRMADSLGQIAAVAQLETKLQPNKENPVKLNNIHVS